MTSSVTMLEKLPAVLQNQHALWKMQITVILIWDYGLRVSRRIKDAAAAGEQGMLGKHSRRTQCQWEGGAQKFGLLDSVSVSVPILALLSGVNISAIIINTNTHIGVRY